MTTPKTTMDIQYHEVKLDDVLDYFVKGYDFPPGTSLFRHEAFIDTAKGKVIIRMTTKRDSDQAP